MLEIEPGDIIEWNGGKQALVREVQRDGMWLRIECYPEGLRGITARTVERIRDDLTPADIGVEE